MTLDTAVVRTLVRTEILMLLRDRRTLLLSVVLPLLLMPLLMFGSKIMENQRQQRLQTAEYAFAVIGPAAPAIRPHIDATVTRLQSERASNPSVLRVREVAVADALGALRRQEIDFVVDAAPQGEAPAAGPAKAGGRESRSALVPPLGHAR